MSAAAWNTIDHATIALPTTGPFEQSGAPENVAQGPDAVEQSGEITGRVADLGDEERALRRKCRP